MDTPVLFQQLGIAVGLGLLVGMQRERVALCLAGVVGHRRLVAKVARLFAVVFGVGCALLWLWPA